jgi:hypothetical protein
LCSKVCEFLLDHCGESIQSIGKLAIDETLHSAHGRNDQFSDAIDRWVGPLASSSPIP